MNGNKTIGKVRWFRLLAILGILSMNVDAAGTDGTVDPKMVQSAITPEAVGSKKIPCFLDTNQDDLTNQNWMLHAQNTDIVQGQPGFHSPYSGANSIQPNDGVRQSISLDLYLGTHLFPGGELYFNPQYYQGFGFAQTHGFADFSNNEAFKAGQSIGNEWIPHAIYRQTFGLGGGQEQLSSGPLQLAEKEDISRITFTIGRMSVTDQFDTNTYANSGRTQFMNWTFVNATAFDYAGDSLGSTYGVTAELNQKDFALRWGGFQVQEIQNGNGFDGHVTKAWQDVVEYDQKISVASHPGVIRFISWISEKNVGALGLTLSNPAFNEDTTLTTKYRYEYGLVLNAEQEIAKDLGAFLRASYRNGQTPSWNTDVDQNISTGVQLNGDLWNRSDDTIGVGVFISGLSNSDKHYFESGGQGILVGDGALNYQPEGGLETYYSYQLMKHITLSADYQLIVDPGYNVDRGPINIFRLGCTLSIEGAPSGGRISGCALTGSRPIPNY